MAIKRVGSERNKKARTCLTCGAELARLKDGCKKKCKVCGQIHYVRIYQGVISLTKAEYPEFCHAQKLETVDPDREMELEEFQEKLKTFRKRRGWDQ